MGTNGTYGFRIDGIDKITYNHWDSYPTCLGETMVKLIINSTDDDLFLMAKCILLVDSKVKATKQQIKAVRDFEKINNIVVSNKGVSTGELSEWYCLLRESQGKPEFYKLGLEYMIDGVGFLDDSLLCEYAYIINTDTKKLEIYRGSNKNPKAKGRYAKNQCESDSEYYGVALFKEITFNEVRRLDAEVAMEELEEEMKEK